MRVRVQTNTKSRLKLDLGVMLICLPMLERSECPEQVVTVKLRRDPFGKQCGVAKKRKSQGTSMFADLDLTVIQFNTSN